MKNRKNVLVSVIMPTYNAAEYLEQTLQSVVGAAFDDVELIAVDDGSKDDSLSILKEYQNKFGNITVVHQENAGPSAARNNGLQYAQGDFVYFLDADDLLETAVLRSMCEKAEKKSADLVIAQYDIFNEFRKFRVPSVEQLSTKEEILWNDRGILWTFSLCNKVFRRSKIEELNLRFPKTNYSEDGVFVMNFVYYASKIVGYPDIVFHYRRMTAAENKSITSAVSEQKVKDYLLSHDMIYDLLVQKCMSENLRYKEFEILKQENEEVNGYANEFLKKEISILFNQFYKLFWGLDENLIGIIVENIERLLKKVDVRTYYGIAGNMPELILKSLPSSYEMAKNMANITVALYGTSENKDEFLRCLFSLSVQRYISYKIIVPVNMRTIIENEIEQCKQIVYIEAEEETAFYRQVIEKLDTKYVLLADSKFIYDKSALLEMYKMAENMELDFLTATIYLENEDQSFPCSFHGRTLLRVKNYRDGRRALREDGIMGNKLICSDYLQSVYNRESVIENLPELIYRQGYFAITEKCYVVFVAGNEENLYEYIKNKKIKVTSDEIEEIKLSDSRFLTNQIEVYKKLRTSKVKKDAWKREFIYKVSNMPVKNRVLFFSIRRDGELDDNLKCVVSEVKGDKIIASKMLPHDSGYKLKMYYYIATSKVIVTDDYIRYLRLFPLKQEQRVIQLWHACGAFKKFGLQGTNLSLGLERATHIQYNLVSVSAENIRQIYASAFDIDISNVVALGVPRTDMFFDEKKIVDKKTTVLKKFPDWKDKEIILYAPTFRDRTGDRSRFEPQIDFELLSQNLRQNQIFVIAPHPVMTIPILKKKYSNIFEIRSVHTIDLMFVSDILVTDYSSVIFEYSLLRKPIFFFCYDLELYDRGFYLPYDENLPGKIAKTQEALMECLTSENRLELSDKYDQFVNKYMGACDGNVSKRVGKLINDYLGGKDEE